MPWQITRKEMARVQMGTAYVTRCPICFDNDTGWKAQAA